MVVLAALVALLCALVTGARLVGGGWHTPLPQLAAFAPWAAAGWSLVLVLLLALGWWWPALAVVAVLTLHLVWLLPRRGSAAARPEASRQGRQGRPAGVVAPEPVRVRLLTVNVLVGEAEVADIVRLARAADVDLLTVQEALPDLAARLQAQVGGWLGHHMQCRPDHDAGTLIWSRWPVRRAGDAYGAGGQIVPIRLQVPGTVPLAVTAVHTMSPGLWRIRGWTRDLASVEQAAAGTVGPHVLLGDFNAGRDHGPFRRVLDTGLVDAADAVPVLPWRGFTWPVARGRPVAVRLDHVLVTPATVRVRSLEVLRIAGTDHRGLLAELELSADGSPIIGR